MKHTPIHTYIVNIPSRLDRRRSVESQFQDKPEFDVIFVEAVQHHNGAVGIWQSLIKVIQMAQNAGYERIIFCEDDHIFTPDYSAEYLYNNIREAEDKGAELIAGGICGYGVSVPVGNHLYWIDWYWGNQFLVINKKLFPRILEHNFAPHHTADGVLSWITNAKMTIFPFISVQKEFGYSDITATNGRKGFINGLVDGTVERLRPIHSINRTFNHNIKK